MIQDSTSQKIASPLDDSRPRSPRGRALDRFVARFPELRDGVDAVVERAAQLRAAAQHGFTTAGIPEPVRDAAFFEARRSFELALDALGELAAQNSRRERTAADADADAVAGAVDDAISAALRLRVAAHAFSPPRRAVSDAARAELVAARAAFNEAYKELERKAIAARVRRLPWQLELSSHHDPDAGVRELEVTGYALPDTPAGRMPWGERCWLSGTPFHTDNRARPSVRHRSLDNVEHVLCDDCRRALARFRRSLDELAPRHPESVERAARALPLLYEEYLPEAGHPAFVRLGLVDFPSLPVALSNMFRAYAGRPLFGSRGGHGRFARIGAADRASLATGGATSSYSWDSYDDVRRWSLRLAYALERGGARPGDRVGVLAAENCREFYLAEFACVFSRLVVLGLPSSDTAQGAERVLEILAHTEARVLVADARSASALLATLRSRCPALERVVVFGPHDGVADLSSTAGLAVTRMDDLIGEALESESVAAGWRSHSGIGWTTGQIFDDEEGARAAQAEGVRVEDADEVFTIMYTSGSTGRPKGSVLTRRRWAEEGCSRTEIWPHVAVSFQPPAALADRGTVWRALHNGGRVGFARRGAELFLDARAIRPTIFDVPPVIWNALYARYKDALGDADLDGEQASAVRQRFRDVLGGRLAIMAVGGAPPDPGVSRAMESIFGIPMFEGYAATEVGTIASNGVLAPGLDYKLVDRPELGLTSADRPHPRGELAVRSPRSSDRYYLDDDSSRESFTEDGYFLTGDLVELRAGGRVRILGRRKLFFKLAGAEFVSPEPLEKAFGRSPLVEQILVTALPTASQIVAVVVPARDDASETEVLADLRRIAHDGRLRACETPAGVVLVPRVGQELPWTAANGLLTQSYKLNRRALEERYRAEIAAAYARTPAPEESVATPAAPARSTEELLRRVVAAVLGVSPAQVDLDATFAENGGTSLTSMDLLLRLEEVFAGKHTAPGESLTSERSLQTVASSPLRALVPWLEACAGTRSDRPESASPRPTAPATTQRVEPSPRAAAAGAGAAPAVVSASAEHESEVARLASSDAEDIPRFAHGLPEADSADVFVTGTTGLLGVHLLALLARELPPGARVFALARAADHAAAASRLRDAATRYERRLPAIGALGAERGERVVAVAGRLESDRFGLAEDDWRALSRRAGAIYHLGAAVDHFGSYPQLREANVLGTRRVLELAASETQKALHFVSSVNVAMILSQLGARTAYEELALPPRVLPETVRRNAGYAVTKLVSERLVQGAYERLAESSGRKPRFSVSRPSLVSWSPATGCSNPQDWLSRLLDSCLALRAVPGGEEVAMPFWIAETETSARGLDLVPVDWVALVLARLGDLTMREALPAPTRPSGAQVPTFHVCNTAPGERGLVSFQRFVDLLALADHEVTSRLEPRVPTLRYLPRSRWLLEVEVRGAPFRPFVRRLKQSPPSMARAATGRLLAAMDGEPPCPGFDVALFETYVRRHHAARSAAAVAAGAHPS